MSLEKKEFGVMPARATELIAKLDMQPHPEGGALMGCTVGPGFDFADFKLLAEDETSAAKVREQWPDFSFLV